jgi:hypothetical protein
MGVVAYRAGQRPEPKEVFARLIAVINRFIDFDQSLAGQAEMCEFIGCEILATWMLEAFTVIGYVWPTGEPGSGKTQLLNICTDLSYLGQTILAGSTYATLRDLADYGATLGFDDAERVFDPRTKDPDKRNLLLSGNRRGNTIALKEADPNGTWHIRQVNTFCPRLFTATRLPDAVLASRTIVVPLVRTLDEERANADPADYTVWPHHRDDLKDDLWALGLAYVREIPPYVSAPNPHPPPPTRDTLSGRDLEPWRPILAIARWLEAKGVSGIQGHMEKLASSYQGERPDFEDGNLGRLVVMALCECAIKAMNSISAIKPGGGVGERGWIFETKRITEVVNELADDGEGPQPEASDEGPGKQQISSKRVGRILAKLRIKQEARPGGKGSRRWGVPLRELKRWVLRYRLPYPEELERLEKQEHTKEGKRQSTEMHAEGGDPHCVNGTHGDDGINGTPSETSGTDRPGDLFEADRPPNSENSSVFECSNMNPDISNDPLPPPENTPDQPDHDVKPGRVRIRI